MMKTAMASGTVSITVTNGTIYSFSPVRLARLISCTGCANGSGLDEASMLPGMAEVPAIPVAFTLGSCSPSMGTDMLLVMVGFAGNGLGVVVVDVVVVDVVVVVVVVVVVEVLLLLLVAAAAAVVVVVLVELLLLLPLLAPAGDAAAGTVAELLLLAASGAAFGSVALLASLAPTLLMPMTSLSVPPSASFLSTLGGVGACATTVAGAAVAVVPGAAVADCTVGVSVFFTLRERWAAAAVPLSPVLLLLLLGFSGRSDFTVSLSLSLATSVNLVILSDEFTGFSTVLAPAIVAGAAVLPTVPLAADDSEAFLVPETLAVGTSTASTVATASCESSKINGSTFISRDANVRRQR